MLDHKIKVEIIGKTTQISPEGEEDTFEIANDGILVLWEDGYTLSYKEGAESGMAGTFTTITGKNGQVFLLRTGLTHCEFRFILGEDHASVYHTPYGDFHTLVQTKEIVENISEEGGRLHLIYVLQMEGVGYTKVIFDLELRIK